MASKVKKPKKAKKALENLDELSGILRHFCGTEENYKSNVIEKIKYIGDVLKELSVDKKVDHARFADKFKNLFNQENQRLKKENKKLKEELEKWQKIKK